MTAHSAGPGTPEETPGDHLRNALQMLRTSNDLVDRTGKLDLSVVHDLLQAVHLRFQRALEQIESRE